MRSMNELRSRQREERRALRQHRDTLRLVEAIESSLDLLQGAQHSATTRGYATRARLSVQQIRRRILDD